MHSKGAPKIVTYSILDILAHSRLSARFQPIMELESGLVHGYEGLIRGPSDSVLHAPSALLKAAEQQGKLLETELRCVEMLVRAFARQGEDALLFINLSPRLLSDSSSLLGELLRILAAGSLSPTRVVIELTEDGTPTDSNRLIDKVADCRSAGFQLALDDLGVGYSSLRRWSEWRPDYVKLDKHFASGINQDTVKLQFVRSLQQIAMNSGAKLIAEGIETCAEFRLMREIGIRFGQGYFIGRPAATAGLTLEVIGALKQMGRSTAASSFKALAIDLLLSAPVLIPEDNNETALAHFAAHPALHALAVVDSGRPIGLINRYTLVDQFSRIFMRELHGRRSCTQFMDYAPLVVDKSTPIEEVGKLVVDRGRRTFTDGFVITDEGQYLGLGSGYDLMQLIMQSQLAAARYANPLTSLPGSVPINNQIQQLLDANTPFHAAYCDLDYFKPFNDIYGYDQGDQVLLALAQALIDNLDPHLDFLGHIGGDDFLAVFRSADWETRCARVLAAFESQRARLLRPEHLAQGGYRSEDRGGNLVFHPLPSLSIGVVAAEAGLFRTHHEVAAATAAAKREAKKMPGHSVFVERRRACAGAPWDAGPTSLEAGAAADG